MKPRACTRTGCSRRAIATLTYVYADSMAVLGPLALRHEPGSYDLCEEHSHNLSAPRGWEVVRLPDLDEPAPPPVDDLLALADAVREVGFSYDPEPKPERRASVVELARRRHLTVLADPDA
ncbi:DUF3499 domain-containing protein [Granulicoccus phenolivorans]|uniref:DUF3499 domain-containing protein n=1 Tax=Granulicoccus phenolivorans TaxID=266854 RepID=UPI00041783C1|nr:DUF3499 domain-containing protein [Granulicoccus phenolivorans]